MPLCMLLLLVVLCLWIGVQATLLLMFKEKDRVHCYSPYTTLVWTPPSLGSVKINVDAHCSPNSATLTRLKKRRQRLWMHYTDCQGSQQLRLHFIILESDSLAVTSGLLSPNLPLNYFGAILKDVFDCCWPWALLNEVEQ